jgi:hypothetical protein
MFERKYETVRLPNNRYRKEHIEVELSTATVDAATWRFAYDKGYREGNFPVPAVLTEVEWNPWFVDNEFHDSITVIEWTGTCFHCGGQANLRAIWDFNFDRCMDFGYGVGEYTHFYSVEGVISCYFDWPA